MHQGNLHHVLSQWTPANSLSSLHIGGISPLLLTLQQLFLGSTFLRYLLTMGSRESFRLRLMSCLAWCGVGSAMPVDRNRIGVSSISRPPWSASRTTFPADMSGSPRALITSLLRDAKSRERLLVARRQIALAGLFFTFGFLATNVAFSASDAAFVETIKAAEPITSALVAVVWGIERLNGIEVLGLATLVAGVILSTYGNAQSLASSTSTATATSALTSSILSCMIVMIANLCFSFRGLYQKLFNETTRKASKTLKISLQLSRASLAAEAIPLDDLNLQFRMQQLGAFVLLLPAAGLTIPAIIRRLFDVAFLMEWTPSLGRILLRYVCVAIINGLAFTSYKYVPLAPVDPFP